MTEKERLYKVLKGEKVDRKPCICPGGMMNMIVEDIMDIENVFWPMAHSDSQMMANLTLGMYKNGGFENFGVPFCMTVEAECMGADVYMGTKVTEPRVVKYPIESVSNWRELKKIDVNTARAKTVIDAIKILKEKNKDIPIVANLTGPVSLASSLMEPMTYYKELRKKKNEAHEFMEFVTDNLIEFGKAQLQAGADVLTISDPSGTGEILGAKTFNEFATPYLNKIIDNLKPYAKGGTIIHICGKLKSIYNELNDLHSDAISFDSITNAKQVVENVHGKIIMGNVSTFAIENGTEESLKNISNQCLNSGVDILSPACGIGVRSKLNNIKVLVECAKQYSN
ncbi:methylcobamide:CoM methyltransferase MtbA [Romboutsia lituseburensis]|uniref:[methyl-Co(III) methanol-specific corrinoid protein]:coenzyme M methyltransferase n=1 Tax=Romboutsia lituseburensis DSM 797 TaxID=1121325 RepID=A0A1G9LFB4_9FIRM|nr:methylcobamide:CoM methyltransferase MtbA [Romboutsia lituseburensis]CEH35286.1 Methylcobamide:CoM methyltransferase MtbA [Romboutsia lituseburensis]SDL60554.1 [methyl-Co(III) methanol-specific corrinoid protein]:coenzyme M methyltransferase [Romboutsia lituseburensis DSM 797]